MYNITRNNNNKNNKFNDGHNISRITFNIIKEFFFILIDRVDSLVLARKDYSLSVQSGLLVKPEKRRLLLQKVSGAKLRRWRRRRQRVMGSKLFLWMVYSISVVFMFYSIQLHRIKSNGNKNFQ